MRKLTKRLSQLVPVSISSPILLYIRNRRSQSMVKEWEDQNRQGATPHILKQQFIQNIAQQFGCKIFVESGTYLGDMVEAQRKYFNHLYSVELSESLWKDAVKRFQGKKQIEILQGDSGQVMGKIVPLISGRALFWLDGHYSGGITAMGNKECPVEAELEAILNHNDYRHVILIDDARLFNGTHDYPDYQELTSRILNKLPGYTSNIDRDIICLLPAE